MKRRAWLSFLVASATIAACGGGLERVAEPDVDAAQKASAQRFATRFYEGCKSGRHEPLGDDTIPEMRDTLTPEKQKETCASVADLFGTYESLDYAETWKVKSLRLYRFKGRFSKGGAPEIRVVMDSGGKVGGFWLRVWAEKPE